MPKVQRPATGSKPVGKRAAAAPASDPPSPSLARTSRTPIRLSSLRERQQALQECDTNRMLWKTLTAARELRDEILFFVEHVESHDNITLAAHALEDAGIAAMPDKAGDRDFGPNTFHTVIRDFKAIATAIHEHVSCVAGDIPPPPVTKREAA